MTPPTDTPVGVGMANDPLQGPTGASVLLLLLSSLLLAGCLGSTGGAPSGGVLDQDDPSTASATDRFSGAWHDVVKTDPGWTEQATQRVRDRTGDTYIDLRNRSAYDAFDAKVTFRWNDSAVETEWRFLLWHITSCPDRADNETRVCTAWRWAGQGTSPGTVQFDETDIAANESVNATDDRVTVDLLRPEDWPIVGHGANAQLTITWEAVVEYR